jgi:hypothetical protein
MQKKILFSIFFAISVNVLYAQPGFEFNIGILKGTVNELCYNATINGIYLVQSEYVLVSPKTKKEFGRAGNDFFGRKYGVAPLVNGRLILPNYLNEPWKDEELLSLYDTLQPKLHKVSIRPIYGGTFELSKLSSDTITKTTYVVTNEKSSFNGSGEMPTSAYIVYFAKDSKADSLVILPNVKKVKVNWADKSQPKIIDFQIPLTDFLGGVLFSETVDVGIVRYNPLASFNNEGGIVWSLSTLATIKEQVTEKPKSVIKGGDLTPIPPKSEEKPKELPKPEEKNKKKKGKGNHNSSTN